MSHHLAWCVSLGFSIHHSTTACSEKPRKSNGKALSHGFRTINNALASEFFTNFPFSLFSLKHCSYFTICYSFSTPNGTRKKNGISHIQLAQRKNCCQQATTRWKKKKKILTAEIINQTSTPVKPLILWRCPFSFYFVSLPANARLLYVYVGFAGCWEGSFHLKFGMIKNCFLCVFLVSSSLVIFRSNLLKIYQNPVLFSAFSDLHLFYFFLKDFFLFVVC